MFKIRFAQKLKIVDVMLLVCSRRLAAPARTRGNKGKGKCVKSSFRGSPPQMRGNLRNKRAYMEPSLWTSWEERWGLKNIQPLPTPHPKKEITILYYLHLLHNIIYSVHPFCSMHCLSRHRMPGFS